MSKKKYKDLLWDDLDGLIRKDYSDWIGPFPQKHDCLDDDMVATFCSICNAVVSSPIPYGKWRNLLTTEDQEHLHSSQHKTGLLLKKLSEGSE